MKYQNHTINPEAYAYETEATALVPCLSYDQLMPSERPDFSPKALQTLSAEQEYHMAVEQSRALLAYQALNLTTQLSAVETALAETCPAAQPRLDAIVKCFTVAQEMRILKF